jgi:cytochrome b
VMIKVWDPLVRVFHWGLVAAFALAWLTSDEGKGLHELAGYAVLALIGGRLVWGLVGPHYARFSQFVRGPGSILRYVGDVASGRERRYIGHNPAAAVMIVALLATLSATAFTGWLMADPSRQAMLPDMPAFISTAWADDGEGGIGGREGGLGNVKEIHEALATLMLVLAGLHVAGMAMTSFRHRENLAASMVTGLKREPGPDDVA